MKLEIYESPRQKTWDDLAAARFSTVYHQSAWLNVLSAASRLPISRILVDIDGEASIGLPFCVRQLGPLRAVLSPPPGFGIGYLGPMFGGRLGDSRRREKNWIEAMEGLLQWIDERYHPGLVYVRGAPFVRDVRPFIWRAYRVKPLYTYREDISLDPQRLLGQFDSSVRSDILRTASKVEVRPGGRELLREIHTFVAARYQATREKFGPSLSYLTSLYDELGPTRFQPVGVHTERGLEGGAIVTFQGNEAAFWQGAIDPDHSRLPLTTHLIWQSIQLAKSRGCSRFELVGANTRRLVAFKSKFAFDLESFFEADLAKGPARLALAAYRRLGG